MDTSVLRMPNFEDFVLECDASGSGVGVVLIQHSQPISYMSKTLKGRLLSLLTHKKMFIAVLVVKKWRHYLFVTRFIIRDDQISIKIMLDQKIHTETQGSWVWNLAGFDDVVECKKGKENNVVDGLSRKDGAEAIKEAEFITISILVPQWLERVH